MKKTSTELIQLPTRNNCLYRRKSFKINSLLILLILFLVTSLQNNVEAQCGPTVPSFTVNLTGSPDSVWQSPPVVRTGNCCGTTSPDRCVQFLITLDPAAVAINFEITGGAIPPGALFYQINCGPQITAGQSVCITGVGPHLITFCKPGNNDNQYSITSIPQPIFPPGGTVREGCTKQLEVLGLVQNTITWNSIFPGGSGAYNSYLSCIANCSNPNFTAPVGAPPYIDYRVCGFPIASGCGFNFTVCDTIRVYTATALTGSVTPNPATYCPTSPGINLTASAGGGILPYQFTWKDGVGTTVGTGTTYFASAPGNYSVHITDSLSPGCPTTIVNVPVSIANISLTPSQVNVSCNGNFDGQASVSATGGTSPYTYLWNNTATTSSISGLPANSFTVTVTDAGGCTASTTINITQPPPLSANITSPTQGPSGTNISCNGQTNGSATANPSGGVAPYNYLWNTSATTQTINNLGAGFYQVTVTDQNGCIWIDTLTLTEPDTLVVLIDSVTFNSGSTIQCFGSNNGEVTAIVNGGTAPYTFTWSTGATTANIVNQPAGPVSIVVEDANGCTAGPVSFIFVQPPPFSTGINSPTYAGGYNISCNGGSDGSVDLTILGASPPYTYLWSNGDTTQDITGVPAGTYTVTATDFNGCTTSMTIDLFEPPAYTLSIFSPTNPSGYNIGCNGETNGTATANPLGGTPPYNYNWNTGSFAQTITDLGAGFYEVTVTDANGCILSDTITLTQPDTVVALISSVTVIGGTNASCFGATDASATVNVSGGTSPYSFLWSTGATTDTITGVGAGTITVLVMDANGCSDDDDFTITQPDSMEASISASLYNGGFNVSCNSATDGVANIFVFGGTGPYTYLWSNGGTNDFINGIGSGIYSVTVTDANGCTLVDSITLVQPDPMLNTMTPFVYPSGNNISCAGATDGSINIDITGGTAPYSYIWSHGPTTEDVSGLGIGSYTVTVTDDNGCTVSGTVVLDEAFPAISVTSVTSPTYAGGWNVSCNAGVDGAVNATASGGAPPYTWYWSNGDSTQNISGVSVSIYIVTVTDLNGCTASDSITLTEPALLTSTVIEIASTGGTGVSCAGGTDGGADLTVNGGTVPYTFLWSTSDTTEDLSNVAAGTYFVTITDANGCTTADTVTITDPSILSAVVSGSVFTGGNNISCNGASDGSITLAVNGGSPSYTYQWSNSDTTQNLSGVPAGTYIVTVTDINNCTASDTITLTEPAIVTSSQIPLTYVGGNNVSCNGASDGAIDVTPSGGIGPYTYLWSTTDTSEDVSGLPAGSYTVTVTDVNGCTGEATIVLTEPVILDGVLTSPTFAGGYNVSCGGSDGSINLAITGGNTAYTYIWSNGETTQNIDSLAAGTYTVTITDANGCTFSDNITLTQPGAYSSAITSPTYNGYNITCNGANDGAIDLTMSGGTPPYNYIWSTSDTIEDLSGVAPGLYTVTVTDDNNCTITTSITLTEPPVLQSLITSPTNPGGYNINCFGGANGSATVSGIDGTPGYTYLWSNGSTSATITNLSIGPHIVTITDANNCTVTDSITLTEPPILAVTSISSPQYPGGWNISCNGGDDGAVNITVAGGAPGYTYTWSNGDTTQNINNVSVTIYIVTVTDVNGCTATNSITLTEPQLLTSNIIPAVTPGGTNISCNGGSDGSVNLVVNGGTAGYTFNWSNGSTLEDPGGLTAGTYYVTITDTNGCVTADTVTLTEPSGMNASTVTSNYNGSGVSCNNACDGNIDLTVGGGASPYTYLWNNSTTGQDLLNLCSGTYSVTITDANGCTTTIGATITQPAPNTVIPTVSDYNGFGVSCNNSCDGYINLALSGGTSPYSISWNTGDTTANIASLCAGNYSYTVTDANNCTVTNSVTITQSQPISITGVTTNSTCNSFCDGTVNITPSGGASNYTYSWSSGQTTEDITGACAGSYTVTITDANGCSNTATYNVTEPSPIAVSAGVDQFVCGGSTNLNANVPSSGSGTWTVITGSGTFVNTNNPFTTVNNLSAGMNTFMWTITDGPCAASASVNIFSDEMVEAIVYPDDTICDNFYTLQAESPTIGNGTWSVSGNSTAVISDPFSAVTPVSGLMPGPNVFIWTVTNGTCTDTARVIITIDGSQQCDSLAMPTGISPNSDGFNDAFVVLGLLRYPDNEILIFNRWGNEVYYEKNYANDWHGVNKSGDNLPDGTYFVILRVFSLNRVLKGYVDIRR